MSTSLLSPSSIALSSSLVLLPVLDTHFSFPLCSSLSFPFRCYCLFSYHLGLLSFLRPFSSVPPFHLAPIPSRHAPRRLPSAASTSHYSWSLIAFDLLLISSRRGKEGGEVNNNSIMYSLLVRSLYNNMRKKNEDEILLWPKTFVKVAYFSVEL